MTEQNLLAAVEAGGTKFRAAVVADDLTIVDQVRIATSHPIETLEAVLDFFARQPAVASLGIASFGPLIVDPTAPEYGSLAKTPKPDWSGAPLLRRLRDGLAVPAEIQTDVEAAAVAEYELGAGQGSRRVAYVTVGTGIGVGVAIDGVPFRGRDHLELGHIPIRRVPGDSFLGLCPFHGECLEGMASGPAVAKRWGVDPASLDEGHEAWELEADYLGQLSQVIVYAFSPDRILFSGGVGATNHLAPRIAASTQRQLAGYSVSLSGNPDLIATAALGNDAGLLGAALLARSLL